MIAAANILAEGIPTGLIFAAAVVALWAVNAIFSPKARPELLKRPSREAQDLAEVRRRIREQQTAQKPAVTPRIWQQQQHRQQQQRQQPKKKKKQRPPPMPAAAQAVVRSAEAIVERIETRDEIRAAPPPLPESTQEIGTAPPPRRLRNETARNVRLMLQRNGIAEAFVLAEVLGKPKALQEP